jgi:Protein kinase domain
MNEQMELLEKRWRSLCDVYLPVVHPGEPWRLSRLATERDPAQGWKLHISATILTACDVLNIAGPILRRWDALYKAPQSILELKRINTGLYYGYSQIGKFITVYPQRVEDAVQIAREMDQATKGLPCPRVPSDRSLHDTSCVFYRYGAFRARHVGEDRNEDPEGPWTICAPDGSLIPDKRTRDAAVPSWEVDPFLQLGHPIRPGDSGVTPLKTTYRAYEAVSQRGKGGVYKAINLRFSPAHRCIIKEGRMNGETDWDGTDGFQRILNEKRILERLLSYGIPVAQIVDYFTVGRTNFLVLESVDGTLLHSMITRRNRLPIPEALLYGAKLAEIVGSIHDVGVAWRDCKPLNVIIDGSDRLRPLDFEGACLSDEAPLQPWGTYGYTPPEWLQDVMSRRVEAEDLYALGATLHHIFSGRPPESDAQLLPIGKLRRGIPPEVRGIVSSLTAAIPDSRPAATVVAAALYSAFNNF